MPANVPAWINLTFENNWHNYFSTQGGDWEPLQIRVWERSGLCEIRGLIRKTTGTAAVQEIISTLPPSATPLNSFNLVSAGGLNNDTGLVQITTAAEGAGSGRLKYLSGNIANIGIYRAYPVATA